MTDDLSRYCPDCFHIVDSNAIFFRTTEFYDCTRCGTLNEVSELLDRQSMERRVGEIQHEVMEKPKGRRPMGEYL